MNAEQRRRANRLRVARGLSDEPATPGFSGAEIVALNKLTTVSRGRGKTEFEDGWRGMDDSLVLGRGEAA